MGIMGYSRESILAWLDRNSDPRKTTEAIAEFERDFPRVVEYHREMTREYPSPLRSRDAFRLAKLPLTVSLALNIWSVP